jgi:membrane protein implicated in regulation of membrane protease activity
MEPLYQHVSPWLALCLGLILMTGELLVPATVFLWTGISSVLVAVPLALMPDFNLLEALCLWVLLSVLAVVMVRRYHIGHPAAGQQIPVSSAPNQYGIEFVGQTVVLGADSQNREVRVSIRGASWGLKLPGGDLKAGTQVRITSVEGIYLVGEPIY